MDKQMLIKLRTPLLFLLITAWLIPALSYAATVVRTGGSIGIAQDQVVEGDFYALGESVTLSGEVTSDLLAAGTRVIINGEVGGDALVFGATVDVNGNVRDDVRVIGTAVSISGEVEGNLVVIAQTLKILSTANIKGDVLFYGGSAEVAGTLGRDLLGRSENVRIDGEIAGGVDVRTGQLTLGERANILGHLRYESAREIIRSHNATVAGDISRSDVETQDEFGLAGFVMVFLIALFGSLVFYLLLPGLLRRVSGQVVDHPLRSALIGVSMVLLMPLASAALFVSTLGLVVGGVVLPAFISFLMAAYAASGVVMGVIMARVLRKPDEMSILWIIAGTFILHMIITVPVIGASLVLGLVIVTTGALVEVVIRQLRGI